MHILERLLRSGQLVELARGCRIEADLARKIGITPEGYGLAKRRLKRKGVEVPDLLDMLLSPQQPVADFGSEEDTSPSLPEYDFAEAMREQPIHDVHTRLLGRDDVPDGSVIFILSDIHIPHHDKRAVELIIECAEAVGCTHAILNGDIADCGVSSRHAEKAARDRIAVGTLAASVEPGRWIYDWARTKRCWLGRGNHERWVENLVAGDASLTAADVEGLMELPVDGDGWTVYDSATRLRLGSLVIEHGHGVFPSGAGGMNPGQRMKTKAPNQTTVIGHLHRKFGMWWTTQDEHGIPKTHAAVGNGHLSMEHAHVDYAGGYPGWQQSFMVIRVWYDDMRPRFTIDQPEVFRDRYNRPMFEYQGRIFK